MTYWGWRAANATLFDAGAFGLPLNESDLPVSNGVTFIEDSRVVSTSQTPPSVRFGRSYSGAAASIEILQLTGDRGWCDTSSRKNVSRCVVFCWALSLVKADSADLLRHENGGST
jgi:hypothetical protein